MGENALEEFRDGIRRGIKAAVFQILTEMHKDLSSNPSESVIQHFWKRFRLIGYSKIKRAVDLYLYQCGYYEIGADRFFRIRTVDHSKQMIDIGMFLIQQAYRL